MPTFLSTGCSGKRFQCLLLETRWTTGWTQQTAGKRTTSSTMLSGTSCFPGVKLKHAVNYLGNSHLTWATSDLIWATSDLIWATSDLMELLLIWQELLLFWYELLLFWCKLFWYELLLFWYKLFWYELLLFWSFKCVITTTQEAIQRLSFMTWHVATVWSGLDFHASVLRPWLWTLDTAIQSSVTRHSGLWRCATGLVIVAVN